MSSNDCFSTLKYDEIYDIVYFVDYYHMNIEENNIGEAIRLTGDKLVGFHTGDNNRTALGRGHIYWDEIFTALKDINYQGRIVVSRLLKWAVK